MGIKRPQYLDLIRELTGIKGNKGSTFNKKELQELYFFIVSLNKEKTSLINQLKLLVERKE